MQKYKSIFKESQSSMVDSEQEATQIEDISNLEWGKTFKSKWDDAISKCPPGWRLPTVQELYTASVEKVEGFKPVLYWSSSRTPQYANVAWGLDFDDGRLFHGAKKNNYSVRCVREKKGN